jgi:hypothetical protein
MNVTCSGVDEVRVDACSGVDEVRVDARVVIHCISPLAAFDMNVYGGGPPCRRLLQGVGMCRARH